jgi:hypothetical protein
MVEFFNWDKEEKSTGELEDNRYQNFELLNKIDFK